MKKWTGKPFIRLNSDHFSSVPVLFGPLPRLLVANPVRRKQPSGHLAVCPFFSPAVVLLRLRLLGLGGFGAQWGRGPTRWPLSCTLLLSPAPAALSVGTADILFSAGVCFYQMFLGVELV